MSPPKTQFSDLSDELRSLVFNHVLRPSDLVSLCLTSNNFHQLAVRNLYHTLTLDVGSKNDTRIASLLNPRNIGLKYVRNVELYKAEVEHDCNLLLQAEFAIRMLLEFLPENTLEKFSWHPWRSFSGENLKLLYRRQKKMKWLEAIAIDKEMSKEFIESLKLDTVMDNVEKLGLYPDSRDTLALSHELLKRAKKVNKITLHANYADAENPPGALELQDTPTQPGLVTRTIFAHLLPFDQCTPMVLKELTLNNIHVRFASDTFCRFIDFPHLKTLRVFHCLGAESLFAELCRSRSLPLSLTTLEFKHEDDSSGEASNTLNTFLTLITGLRRLCIDIGNAKPWPSEASITRHAKTLKELLVHSYEGEPSDRDTDEHIWENDSFVKICEACKELEQLSVAFPPSPIYKPTDEYTRWRDAIATLPKLAMLNVTTWPSNSSGSSRLPTKAYERLLSGFMEDFFFHSEDNAYARAVEKIEQEEKAKPQDADTGKEMEKEEVKKERISALSHPANLQSPYSILRIPTCSPLTTVAFGSSDKIYERTDSLTCRIAMRGITISPTNPYPTGAWKPVITAVPVAWATRKFDEPKSDLLEWGLQRAVRPPCADSASSGSRRGGRDEDLDGW